MMQSPSADRVLTGVNAVALTIGKNLRGGAPRRAGYCNVLPVSNCPLVSFEVGAGLRARIPMKSWS
jgi:hypothetical protein